MEEKISETQSVDVPVKPKKPWLKIVLFSILGLVSVGGLVFAGYKLGQSGVQPPGQEEEYCVKAETGEKMSLGQAEEIALSSECVKEGSLKEEYFCNEDTGTWWLDLDIEKEGCAPACVIDVSTKKAKINWRCTGLIPQ